MQSVATRRTILATRVCGSDWLPEVACLCGHRLCRVLSG